MEPGCGRRYAVERRLNRWGTLALGWLVIIVGIIMIPAPGPGMLVIFAGTVILSRESAWARWLLARCRGYIRRRWPGMHKLVERLHDWAGRLGRRRQ